MKRILTMTLVCMMLFCGTAFAAESGANAPRLTLRAAYDGQRHQVTATLVNEEPQEFRFSGKYILQKWTGAGWVEVSPKEELPATETELTLWGDWDRGSLNRVSRPGMAMQDYSLQPYGDRLEAGRYRFCLPLYTEYYPDSQILLTYPKDGPEEKRYEFWKVYFMTEIGRPYFGRADRVFLTEGHALRMEYTLTDEFTVE